MHRVHLSAIPEVEQASPTRKFHSFSRNVSLALGGLRNTGLWGGGHPFDLQLRRVPPGAAICPYHSHLAQWELFLIRSGRATVRAGAETRDVGPGDCFVHPPGEAHQLTNTGGTDLDVLIVADNPPLDAFHYPDSDKWGLRPPGLLFRTTPADYFDGEDAPPAGSPAAAPSALALPLPAPAPFATRCRNLEAMPWNEWGSPKGKFRGRGRDISLELGAKPRAPTGLGGHPFDLELGRLAPGERGCPFHRHAAQWELYLFTAGRGEFRWNDERFAVGPDDAVLTPPGVAHDFRASPESELTYLLIADNPPVDYWHYPDSNKWGLSLERKFFHAVDADYYDGEE